MYSILAMPYGYRLGWLKLDEVLVDHFLKELIKKHTIYPRNERSLAKLRGRRGLYRWAPLRPFLPSGPLMDMICTLPLTDCGTSSRQRRCST